MSSDEAKGGETAPAADAGSGAGAGGGDDGAATAAPSEGDRKSVDAPLDRTTKSIVQRIPLLTVRAGPRDGEEWGKRLKEELQALIAVSGSLTQRILSVCPQTRQALPGCMRLAG